MPALITHNLFGTEVYERLLTTIGGSRCEADAFILGNQGPDPLFYAVLDPRLHKARKLGSIMHKDHPSELILAFKKAIDTLPEADRSIGRAYALGFLCHYILDTTTHPFVYWQEYRVCDAGEPGLTRENGFDVHVLIESELDELVLTAKRECTVREFNPIKAGLRGDDRVLDIISQMYVPVASEVYGMEAPATLFSSSLKWFRRVQEALYSPDGKKRDRLGRLEELVRPYSFCRAMSHRSHLLTESIFDNHEHEEWADPFTGELSTTGFWDLYQRAFEKALAGVILFDNAAFDLDSARMITGELNFSGDPVVARIVAIEAI